MELGIGDGVLVKALANSTGRSTQQIKADMQRTGDLGVVAETSKGSQRTMFQVTTCFRHDILQWIRILICSVADPGCLSLIPDPGA